MIETQTVPEVPMPPILTDLVGEDPRDASQDQLRELRELFMDKNGWGLFFFASFVCGYDKLVYPLHFEISQFLSKWGSTDMKDGKVTWEYVDPNDSDVNTSYRRLMLCIPRDCFKTTMGTKALSLWTLCQDPDNTIGIFNENADNAESWVGSMCEIVESSILFQLLWPEIIPKGITSRDKDKGLSKPRSLKWGPTGMRFERGKLGISELSVEPHGIGGTAVGKHFTHKILDDIIGEKSVRSPDSQAIMNAAKHWADNSRPLERPAEKGKELVVHTPWAYADVYTHMLKRWPGEYLVYKRHILEDEFGRPDVLNGKSIFPEKMSTKQARKILKIDPYVNSAQYMCLPKPGKETSFDAEWFRYGKIVYSGKNPIFRINDENYDRDIMDIEVELTDEAPQFVPLEWMTKAVLFDPIPGDPRKLRQDPECFHGLVVVGKDPWGRRFCLESARYRCTPEEIFDKIMSLMSKWYTRTLAMEEVSFMYVFDPLFRLLAETRYQWCPDMLPVSPGGRHKDERILSCLQTPNETGFWYYNQMGTMEVIQELSEFPHCTSKDVIDAMAYTDEVILRPETPAEKIRSYHSQRMDDRGICGYGF